MIKEAGLNVLEAANADKATIMLETRLDISVVFADIDMPGTMNGIRLAHAVRDRWPPIKIIATSGHYKFQVSPIGPSEPLLRKHTVAKSGQTCLKQFQGRDRTSSRSGFANI